MNISKHFNRGEFACRCGCGFDVVDVELSMLCEFVRNFVKHPVNVNSGCRCKQHNFKEGGAVNSKHLLGKAADLEILDFKELERVYDMLCFAFPDKYGFIMYDGFIHVDCRSKKYRSDRRSKK